MVDPTNGARPGEVRPAVSLEALAKAINAAHAKATKATRQTLEAAREAGEALAKAKGEVGHGGWGKWLERNVKVNPTMARRYMRVAEGWDQIGTDADLESLSISSALRRLAGDDEDEEQPSTSGEPARPRQTRTREGAQAPPSDSPADEAEPMQPADLLAALIRLLKERDVWGRVRSMTLEALSQELTGGEL